MNEQKATPGNLSPEERETYLFAIQNLVQKGIELYQMILDNLKIDDIIASIGQWIK